MRRALLSLMWLTLAGCGRVPLPADFVFITNAPHNSHDPQQMSYMHDIRLTENLLEPLLRLDYADLSLEPAAATHWSVSDDGLTYTFHLRSDARWSNGDPVTAGDFLNAWRRGMTPDLASPYADLLFHIRGARDFFDYRNTQLAAFADTVKKSARPADEAVARDVWAMALDYFDQHVGLHAPDDLTLVVELSRPTPYFPQLVAFATCMPVHTASLDAATTFDPNSGRRRTEHAYWRDPRRFVSNGPYVLGDVKFRQYVHLDKSPTYWNRDAVRNRSIRELIVEEATTALLLYERGQADFWPDVPGGSMGQSLLAQRRDDAHPTAMAGTYFYNFNCAPSLPGGRDNPLHDARVRRALSMAIDREALVSGITGLNEIPAATFVPPAALAHYQPPVERGVRFDPGAARQLLKESGYNDPAAFAGITILFAPISVHSQVAEAVQHMWREHLGLQITLDARDPKAAAQRKQDRQYAISQSSWFGDYPDPNTWLEIRTSIAPNNQTNWSSARYDERIDAAGREPDPDRRLTLLRDAETILVDEQPMAMLYHYVFLNLYDPRKVQGLQPNAWGRWRMDRVIVQRE